MTKRSKITTEFLRRLSGLGQNNKGAVAIPFAIAGMAMVMSSFLVIDYARKTNAIAKTQAAIDGAAMAATAALNSGETEAVYEKAAQDFFDDNKPKNLIGSPVVSIKVDFATGTLVARTDASIKAYRPKIFGPNTLRLTNDHSASGEGEEELGGGFGTTVSLPSFTPEHKGEIAMVMDYSGSMNWYLGGERKYITMRDEAAKLVSALSQAKTNDYVKFGVVPFSSEVYTKMKKKFWYGYTGNQKISSCTRDRKYPHNLVATKPKQKNNPTHATRFGWVDDEGSSNPNSWWFYHKNNGNSNYRNNCDSYSGYRNLVVQDMTKNHNDTYNKILAMSPYANTHIAVGMEFGYHLLSPAAPFTKGVAYNTEDTEKAVILLTDGAQTTQAFGAGGSYQVSNGENNFATICANMKSDGIRIITVSYDLYDTDTENRLRSCATGPQDFYDADSKPELVAAFNGIVAKLARDMFLAK